MPDPRFFTLLTTASLALGLLAFPLAGCGTQEEQIGGVPHKKIEIKKTGDNRYQRTADPDDDPATTDFLR